MEVPQQIKNRVLTVNGIHLSSLPQQPVAEEWLTKRYKNPVPVLKVGATLWCSRVQGFLWDQQKQAPAETTSYSDPFPAPSAALTPFPWGGALPQGITHPQIPTSDPASRKCDLSQAEFQTLLLPVLTAQVQDQPRIATKPQLSNTVSCSIIINAKLASKSLNISSEKSFLHSFLWSASVGA